MSITIRLPPEIKTFFSLGGPQSLVIRGPPGCGKTHLSISMLEEFAGPKLYISSRVSREGVAKVSPWLVNHSNGQSIVVDASADDVSAEQKAFVLRYASQEKVLGDLGGVSEEFLWLPNTIQEAWSHLPEDAPSLVVIDSWDALIEKYLGKTSLETPSVRIPDRAEIERCLLALMSRVPTNLVLVLERDEPSHLDYLVDGVISTGREQFEGRLERWLTLSKLRGVRVESSTYPFTLEGGRFEAITPAPTSFHPGPIDAEADPSPNEGSLWPGSSAFAEVFGRLPLGRLSILELDPEVPDYGVESIVFPIIQQILSEQGRAIVAPPSGLLPEDFWLRFLESNTAERLRESLRIASVMASSRARPEIEPILLNAAPTEREAFRSRFEGTDEYLEGVPSGSPGGLVVWLDGLTAAAAQGGAAYSPQVFPALVQQHLQRGRIHAIVIGTKDEPLLQPLRSMARLYLRIRARDGRVFIYGVRPRTSGYVLIRGKPTPPTPYGLLRVV